MNDAARSPAPWRQFTDVCAIVALILFAWQTTYWLAGPSALSPPAATALHALQLLGSRAFAEHLGATGHALLISFAMAALGLGARLSRIHPEGVVRAAAGATDAIQMLDRLYDALDCGSLSPAIAAAVQRRLSIPVFDGLARADHPVLRLLGRLGAGPAGAADRDEPSHVLLIQAVLACALGR